MGSKVRGLTHSSTQRVHWLVPSVHQPQSLDLGHGGGHKNIFLTGLPPFHQTQVASIMAWPYQSRPSPAWGTAGGLRLSGLFHQGIPSRMGIMVQRSSRDQSARRGTYGMHPVSLYFSLSYLGATAPAPWAQIPETGRRRCCPGIALSPEQREKPAQHVCVVGN